jgi:hypothetical protein
MWPVHVVGLIATVAAILFCLPVVLGIMVRLESSIRRLPCGLSKCFPPEILIHRFPIALRVAVRDHSKGLVYITIDRAIVKSSATTEMMVSQTDQVFMV